MTTQFTAEIFQNPYLTQGSREVNAIMTITASGDADIPANMPIGGMPTGGSAGGSAGGDRIFGIICDCSGSMQGAKIQAAKQAMTQLVEMMPSSHYFFVVAGATNAQLIVPPVLATAQNKQKAISNIRDIRASGGTCISRWLNVVQEEFAKFPSAMRQALLLTDGQNDPNDETPLESTLKACEGIFECDCRGVGTDWRVAQLRAIAERLLGTTDIIPEASDLAADFTTILQNALDKAVSDVALRLWTPQGAKVLYCKQVSPDLLDITPKAKAISAQIQDYPTGAWGQTESRDYHFCIQVNAGGVGDEMLAGRASLVVTQNGVETKIAEGKILAIWTDDDALSTKIDRRVAHYTGQAELAQTIQDGLEARARGHDDVATAKLGRAVQLAHESNNEATAKLLRRVVEIDDAPTGTVRLKKSVEKADEMMLETRSTKTTRIARGDTP
jgi:von Willebrand factor type A C-terminal domain/von Willebrand factor type A domain